ncbi:MAG: CheW domain-containing protein [Pseudomonadota bacterium]
MARRREALVKLQTRLAEQLALARTQVRGRSWLAVECGGLGFLFPLKEAGEIFAMSPVLGVPHTAPWFLGVANLRGHLHGVVDLARFLGIKTEGAYRDQSRMVAFNPTAELNCALVVDRLAGLRNETEIRLEPDPGDARPAFVTDRYRDQNGRVWQELRLASLAQTEAFLKIVA